jgi:hypothetical protein
VDLTIRKWQREERTTIADKHALDLLKSEVLAASLPVSTATAVRAWQVGNWDLPDKLQYFYTCTSRRASPASRRRRRRRSRKEQQQQQDEEECALPLWPTDDSPNGPTRL